MFPVRLNHFYIAVSTNTFALLVQNEWLRHSFAPGEVRSTRTSATQGWQGLYLYGLHTYIEFLDVSAMPGILPGQCGIALGTEQAGQSYVVTKRLAQAGFPYEPQMRHRQLNGQSIPWFWATPNQIFNPGAPLLLWLMEYSPDFLPLWQAHLSAATGIAQADVLERYKQHLFSSGLAPAQAHYSLGNVSTLHLELPEKLFRSKVAELQAFGLQNSDNSTDAVVQLKGHQFSIIISKTTNASPCCITRIDMQLQHPSKPEVRQLGNTRLEIYPDLRASWHFEQS